MYLVVSFIIWTCFVLSQREVPELTPFQLKSSPGSSFHHKDVNQRKRYEIQVWVQHCVCTNSNSLKLRRSGLYSYGGCPLLEDAPTKLMCKNNVFESRYPWKFKSNFDMVLRLYDTAESEFGFGCFSWFMPNWVLFHSTFCLPFFGICA